MLGFWLGAGVIVLVGSTPMWSGNWAFALFSMPAAAVFVWLLWILLYRPALRYDEQRVVVWNIGRIHVLPWSHIDEVQQALNIVFVLNDGTRVIAQGTPTPKRRSSIERAITPRRKETAADVDGDVVVLESFRQNATSSTEPVQHTWDRVAWLIGVGVAAVLVISSVIEASI